MRTFAAGLLVAVAVLAVATQLALPAFYESRVKDRLEEGGGSADVSVNAFPALTLIGGTGDELEVDAKGLAIDLRDRPERPFERLDGFEHVDVDMRDLRAGAATIERLTLTRDGSEERYALAVRGSATPDELARALGEAAAGELGGLLGDFAGELIPGGSDVEVPMRLRAEVDSRDGKTAVTDATASVAGVPAGPLAELVLGAALERL
jgi:hypothetical protein